MQFFANLVLNWLWGKVSAFLTTLWETILRRKKIDENAAASVEPLKKAETADEIDKAADDALRNL